MKHKYVTLLFIAVLIAISILFVPTLRTSADEEFTFTMNNDISQLTNSSIVLQPLWTIGQDSERVKNEKNEEINGKEYDMSTYDIKRTTTTYLYKIHWMILFVLMFIYITISKSFYSKVE